MNTNFISDSEIDRVLGRIGEYKGPSQQADRPFDRFNMSEDDKSRIRAEYARKKTQEYAINPGLIYSEQKEFMKQPIVAKEKTTRVYSNTSHNAGLIRRSYAFCTDLCIVGVALVAFVYASVSFFGAEHFAQTRIYGSASANIVVWLGALYAALFVLYLV